MQAKIYQNTRIYKIVANDRCSILKYITRKQSNDQDDNDRLIVFKAI